MFNNFTHRNSKIHNRKLTNAQSKRRYNRRERSSRVNLKEKIRFIVHFIRLKTYLTDDLRDQVIIKSVRLVKNEFFLLFVEVVVKIKLRKC